MRKPFDGTPIGLQDPELILSIQGHETFLTSLFILNPEDIFAVKRAFIKHQKIPSLSPAHHGISNASACAAEELHEELLDGQVGVIHHGYISEVHGGDETLTLALVEVGLNQEDKAHEVIS